MMAMYRGGHTASAYGSRAFRRSSSSGTRGGTWVPWSLWLHTCACESGCARSAQAVEPWYISEAEQRSSSQEVEHCSHPCNILVAMSFCCYLAYML